MENKNYNLFVFGFRITLSFACAMLSAISFLFLLNDLWIVRGMTYISNIDLLKLVMKSIGWIILIIAGCLGWNAYMGYKEKKTEEFYKTIEKIKGITIPQLILIIYSISLLIFGGWSLRILIDILKP